LRFVVLSIGTSQTKDPQLHIPNRTSTEKIIMNAKKILLAFDGSTQSLNAAELCWELAAKHPIRLTAQHVVNTVGLWQLLNFELPGLTGSGPYIAAHEAMGKELRSIGETLVSIYDAKAQTHGFPGQCVLDEGDAISEVQRRSVVHDMVVVGHHPYTPQADTAAVGKDGQMPRYLTHFSMAEALARVIDKPLLVVQAQCRPWQRLKLILHGNEGIEPSFRAAADLAAFFDLPLEVTNYFQGEESVEDLPDLTALVKEASRLYPDLELKTGRAKLWPTDGDSHMAQVDCAEDSLVMIPTFSSMAGRQSIFGTTPELFVRYCGVSSLLFWPADAKVAGQKIGVPRAALSN
jgi:nucleotide-binding universal stress UspA family protein